MSFEDSILGSGDDFDPRVANASLIRAVNPGAPPTDDVRALNTDLGRRIGQPSPAPAPPPATRVAPSGPPDFSSQAAPPPEDNTTADFSDQGVPPVIGPPAPPPAPTTLSDYPIEFGKGVLEGGKNMGAAALKGTAAVGIPTVANPAFLDDLAGASELRPPQLAKLQGRVLREVSDRGLQMDYISALKRIAQGGDAASEVEKLRPKFETNNAAAAEGSQPGALTRGFVTGMLKENPENLAETLEGLGHLAPDDFRESLHSASKQVHELSKLSPDAYKKRSGSMWDVKGLDDALTWAGETIGSGVASSVPSLATGVGGAVLGGRVAGRTGAMVGAMGGAAVPSAVQNYGDLYKQLKDEKVDPKAAAQYAAYATPALVALDTMSIGPIITRLGGIKVVQEELARNIAKRVAVEAAKGTGREGITEAMQQAVEEATVSLAADKPFWTAETGKKVIEAGVGGALTGAAMGGASGIKPDTVQQSQQPGIAPPSGGSTSGPATGTGPDTGPSAGPSSPEDIADFVRKARESAPPSDEAGNDRQKADNGPTTPGPDLATMSEAERTNAFTQAREAFDGASMDDILRAYGWDQSSVEQMGEQDKIDQVIRAGQEKAAKTGKFAEADASSNATGNAQAEPQAEPKQEGPEPESSHLRYATLREYGYSDEDIDNMSPAQRKRDFEDAVASGIKPGAAMSKHPKRAAAQPEPDVTSTKPPQPGEGFVDSAETGTGGENQGATKNARGDIPQPGDGTRAAPIVPATAADVQKAKPADPTSAQAEAGNYRHAFMELPQFGLTGKSRISVETGQGQERRGVDANGQPWSVKLDHAAYGRLLGTKGADGEHLDAFIGPHPTSTHVFVIDQHHPGAGFDEHKIMLGFRNPIEALHAYAHAYNDMGKDRIGHVTAMGPEEFAAWREGDTTKALKPPGSGPARTEPGGSGAEVAAAAGTSKETPPGGTITEGSGRPTPKIANRSAEPLTLLQFLASRGGLAPHPELDALDLGNHRVQIPGRKGFFGLIRPTGDNLDLAREAAEEAGYLRGEHNKTSTIRHLLDAIDEEANRKNPKLAEGEEGKTTKKQRTSLAESSAAARDKAIAAAHEDIAAEYPDLPADLHAKAAEIMADERLDVDSAVEMAAVRMVNEDEGLGIDEADIKATYGEGVSDEIRPRPASEDGRPAAPAGDQERESGEGQEAGQHGERVSDAGAESSEGEGEVEPTLNKQDYITGAVRAVATTTQGGEEAVQKAIDDGAPDAELIDTLSERGWGGSFGGRSIERGAVEGRGKVVTITLSPFGRIQLKGKALADAIRRAFPPTTTEPGADGKEQAVIPGAERIGQGEQAQRAADKPLKPKVAQKPADTGLFGDEKDQADLLDLTRKAAAEVETALGEDADRVAPIDIARAAEIMADSPGMDVATAFGRAVAETTVEQGFITEQQAEEDYGPEIQDVLAAGREGPSERSGEPEQERAASGEVGPRGAAQTGEPAGRGEAGEQVEATGAGATESGAAAGRDQAARDEASDTVADQPAAEGADPAQWWDKQLTRAGRADILEQAGLTKPDRVLWRYLSPDEQARLVDFMGGNDGQVQARDERDAGTRGLEVNEGALRSKGGLQERAGLPGVEGRLSGVLPGHGGEADAAAHDRAITGERGLSPGQLRVGDENGSVAESTGVRSTADLSGQDAARGGVGGRIGDQGQDAVSATSDRLVGGENARDAATNIGGDRGVQIAVHAGDAPASTEDVQPAEPGGQAGSIREREGRGSEQAVPRTDSGRTEDDRRVSEGAGSQPSDRAGDGRDAGLSESRTDDASERRAKRPSERAADNVEGENFAIEPGALDEGRGQKTKARDNIRAIELMHRIEAEGRPATLAEQTDLAKYVGWGGIKNAFPDSNGKFADGFEQVGARLRELLDDDEYTTARRSIQYAHYTAEDVVRSMWAAVAKMGFTGGQVFEPGMGVGNFAGMMPPDIAAKTSYAGIELDHTTARIAKLLYPKWGVRQDDFTKTPLPENNYDLVIGNPPFADVAIKSDPKYKQGFLLHDYFFAKSIDAVRPGGLLAFVTSAGTMNKIDPSAREYLADRADLVGAIRLPGDAFKKNAGTEVTTDIIFLRKRLPDDVPGDRTWTETAVVKLPGKEGDVEGNINRYFAENPGMVLGKQDFDDKLYQGRYSVKAIPGADFAADLRKAIDSLPADVMSPWQDVNADHAAQDFNTAEKKEGTYYIGPDGSLHQVSNGVGVKVAQRGKGVENGRTAADMERIKGLIPIRDALREVYSADLAGDVANGERARAKLNKSYDAFVAAFGPINKAVIQTRRPNVIQMEAARAEAREEARYAGEVFKEGSFDATPLLNAKTPLSVIARQRQETRDEYAKKFLDFDEGSFDPEEVPDVIIDKRPNVDPFMDDPESYRLRAIEDYDEGAGVGRKGDVFLKNVISREVKPKINSVNDALLYSLSQYGRVNVPAMAELSKKSESEVIEQLGEQVFKVPGTKDTYQTRDEYLSGNVRKKLAQAEAAAAKNPDFRRNVAALEAAQPIPLAPSQIHATLGMPWIPADTIREFGIKELGLDSLKVRYVKPLAQWVVSGDTDSVAASTTWGTTDRRAPALLQDALNRQSPKIYDKMRVDESSVLNIPKTEAAQEKVRLMQEKFGEWIWQDQERSDRLAGFYNENFNNLVVRQYDGEYLTTPGIASSWNWFPHQKRAIARIIQAGNTYIAHAVGAGKTSEYIGAIMEMRRLGLVRKPMVAVPNHMLAQFTKEWYHQYPTARLAIADEKRFHTDRRKQFIANVAMEDLDAIIITHSSFGMIPISAEFQNSIVQREISQYRELLAELTGGDNRITRSRVEKQIERLEQRLVSRGGRKDSVFTFEEMGVDHLTVDEAHLFRKLDFSTNMSNLKGVSPEGSGMAWDLYVKSLYLNSIRPGRGLVLGSGTPITNTMAELYTLSRYMQPDVLAERGLEKFDAWAGAFGESVSELEQDAAGNYKPVSRFAKFVNVAELSAMVRQVMDVVTPRQLEQYVTRPQLKGGKRQLRLAEKSRELVRFQENLAARMIAIQKRKGPPKKGDDIMLSVINDGRHAAIDMRLAGGTATNVPSKLGLMVNDVFETWEKTKKQPFYKVKEGGGYEDKPYMTGPATQLVFANLGLSGARGFSVPDYIRSELVRRGIPKNEIAYIYDYKSATAKQRLFNDMNEGKVRILIGSVAKMGVGTNVQKRLYATNNLDPLWYPADDEQRVGRIIRQGNGNREVEVRDYSTKGTYDSTMWGMMEKKARFIQGFFEGDPSMRDMDDLGEASQYEQAKAMTTNDPRLIRFTELKQELEKAQRRKTAFDSEVYQTRQRRARAASEIEHYTQRVEDTKKDIAQRVDTRGDAFKGAVGKETFDKRVDFGEALFKRLESLEAAGTLNGAVKVAEVGGFPIYAEVRRSQLLKNEVSTDVFMGLNGSKQARDVTYEVSPLGTVRSIESILGGFEHDLEQYKARLAKAAKFYQESEAKAKARFEGDAEIAALTQQVNDMAAELAKPVDEAPKPAAESEVGEEGEALASLTDMSGLTPDAQQSMAEISAMLRRIVGKIAGDVPMEFHVGMMPVKAPPGYPAGMVPLAGGQYNLGTSLVKLALLSNAERMAKSAFHESYHHIEDKLQTPQERRLMASETPRLREKIKGTTGLSDYQVDNLAGYEVRAIAFQNYAHERANGNSKAGAGTHIGVRMWFSRLFELLQKIKNALRGLGFKSYEDVFNDAYEGRYAGREPGKGGIDPNEPLAAMAGATGPGRRGPPPTNETIADILAENNFNRLASISKALRFGNLNATELRTRLQDRFIRVKKAQDSVGGVPTAQDAYMAETLYYGKTGQQLEELERTRLDPLIEDMKARDIGLEEFNEYLYAKHAPERNAAMDAINHPNLDGTGGRDLRGRGSGMSDEEAAEIMDRITAAGRMADFEVVERRARQIIDETRQRLVDSGLISQEAADAWAAQYKFYVPLTGFAEGTEDETMAGRGPGFDTRARETQRAFGRLSRAAGPLPSLMMQAQMSIVRAEKNKVGNAWLRFVRSHPDPTRWTVNTPKLKSTIDPETGLVTKIVDRNWQNDPELFVTKVGGNPVLIRMEGKDGQNLVRALKNLGTENLNEVLKAIRVVTYTMARLATQWNPNFIAPNLVRDLGEAYINLQAQDQKHFIKQFTKHIIPAIGGAFRGIRGQSGDRYSDAFKEFDAAGGRVRFFGLDNRADVEKNMAAVMRRLEGGPINSVRDAGRALGEGFEAVNGAVENATRLAAYMAARDVGMPIPEAANLALNLTVNFTKRGEYSPWMNALFMFSVAAVNGTARTSKALMNKNVRRAAYGLIALGALSALLGYGMGGDDDAGESYYGQVPEWDRDKNLIIMWPKGMGHDGAYIKIPAPFLFGAFKTVGDRLTGVAYGKEKPTDALAYILKAIVDGINPLGEESNGLFSFIPSFVRPGIHIATNKDWNGRPLYPERQWEKNKPDSEQSFSTTSSASKAIARGLNSATGGSPYKSGGIDVHPGTIGHIMESLTGGLGKFFRDVAVTTKRTWDGEDFDPSKAPIVRRFAGSANSEQGQASRYFAAREEARKNGEDAIKAARKDKSRGINVPEAESFLATNTNSARGERIFKAADEQMKPLRDRKERLEASNSFGDEERQQVERIKQRMRDIQSRARKEYRELKAGAGTP